MSLYIPDKGQSSLKCLFPNFVMHKVWDMPDEFNNKIFNLAAQVHEQYQIKTSDDEKNVGDKEVHFSHKRACFFKIHSKVPEVRRLAQMVDMTLREYLNKVYHYNHSGEIDIVSFPIWIRRDRDQNYGMFSHNHPKYDFVVSYYPRVCLDDDRPDPLFQSGSVRFYDASGSSVQLWQNNNPNLIKNMWHMETPVEGSMIVFEGELRHDVTYFKGSERMCLPINCNVVTPNDRVSSSTKEFFPNPE